MDPVRLEVRPRISVLDAWRQGWQRVFRAPVLIVGITAALACTLGLAWPGQVLDPVSWVLGNDAFSFGGPTGLVRWLGSDHVLRRLTVGLPTLVAIDPSIAVLLFLAGGAIDRLARARRVG